MQAQASSGKEAAMTFEITLGGQPANVESAGNHELGPATVHYAPRAG
jgi:hypothetical protein